MNFSGGDNSNGTLIKCVVLMYVKMDTLSPVVKKDLSLRYLTEPELSRMCLLAVAIFQFEGLHNLFQIGEEFACLF